MTVQLLLCARPSHIDKWPADKVSNRFHLFVLLTIHHIEHRSLNKAPQIPKIRFQASSTPEGTVLPSLPIAPSAPMDVDHVPLDLPVALTGTRSRESTIATQPSDWSQASATKPRKHAADFFKANSSSPSVSAQSSSTILPKARHAADFFRTRAADSPTPRCDNQSSTDVGNPIIPAPSHPSTSQPTKGRHSADFFRAASAPLSSTLMSLARR